MHAYFTNTHALFKVVVLRGHAALDDVHATEFTLSV